MTGISIAGLGIALAILAIAVFTRAQKRAGKPKRAERWEKAEIVRQLLALSELENRRTAATSSTRFVTPTPRLGIRPSHANLKTTAKSALPSHPKTS
jgi:hypothetical protein